MAKKEKLARIVLEKTLIIVAVVVVAVVIVEELQRLWHWWFGCH